MELLVSRYNQTSTDPVKAEMRYKKGDIVVVMPDDHPWGIMENPATFPGGVAACDFVIIKIPGKNPTNAQIEKWLDHIGAEAMTKRRLWEVMTDDVPNNVKNKLRDDGVVTITWAKLKNFIRNKLTDEREL